jgi:two-component system sensor histidine kinase YesM
MKLINNIKFKVTLRIQILVYFVILALIPTLIIGMYYYYDSVKTTKRYIGEVNYKIISHMMDNVDSQILQANNFYEWIYWNNNITELLKRSSLEVKKYDETNNRAIDGIIKQFQFIPVTNHLLSLIIIGINGLDIRYGVEASLINFDDIIHSKWFRQAKNQSGMFWGKRIENYTQITRDKFVVPQCRVIKNFNNGRILGYIVGLYSQDVFIDRYKNLLNSHSGKVYLITKWGNVISTNQSGKVAANLSNEPFFKKMINCSVPFFEEIIDGSMNIITYKKSLETGWILVEIQPVTQIQKQKTIIKRTIILLIVGVIFMCLFLAIFLSYNLARPIKMLVLQVNEISQGNFDNEFNLNINNEIEVLSRSINKMKADISNLLQEGIQKEREKKIIAIKMFQSQINPHFLYNTLNSIKLMARLQGAKGIESVTVSLGRILKSALSGVNEKITLHEEIGIIDDYIAIQNRIRCHNYIQFSKQIIDESILDCMVLKFILQPLVENAIIHGIQPKNGIGKIVLSVVRKDDKLVIEIFDDGVGIKEEKIKAIEEKMNLNNAFFAEQGIGINNVNQRIKLVYGEGFGISFKSLAGQYTKVIIILPFELYSVIKRTSRQ